MQKQTVTMPTIPSAESRELSAINDYSISTPQTATIYKSATSEVKVVPEKFTQATADTNNWSPGLQNVLDQPSAAFPRQLLLGGIIFCLGFVAWAWLGKIEEVGHARGQLVPQGEVYKIHPVESGKVAVIAIKEGQAVKTGQVLVELDAEIANGEVSRLQQLLESYQVELSQKQDLVNRTRLEAGTRAEIAAADSQAQKAAIVAAKAKVATTRDLLAQLRTETAASLARLERTQPLTSVNQERLKQLRADVAAYTSRVERLKPLVEDGALAKEHLFEAEQALRDRTAAITRSQLEEGAITKERLFEAEQTLRDRSSAITQNQGELKQALVEVERLQAGLAQKQAEASTTQLQNQQQIKQLEVEITQMKAKMVETRNLLNSAKTKLGQRFLYAPVDGVVSSLSIRNVGEVVQPGQTIAEMAPQTAPLILSAILPNQEAGFVKAGMPVQIKLDAYPYQDYGIIPGKVISISPDAKPEQHLGEVYQVEVALDRSYITANRQTLQFKAGQTAKADIIIRHRRIADVLLDPIKQLQQGGLNL